MGSRDRLLELWDPHNISVTVEPRNFKYGTEAGGSQWVLTKKCKITSEGVMWGSWLKPYIIWHRDGRQRVIMKKCKTGSKGVMWRSCNPLL